MVDVAQLVSERQVVALEVTGSIPVVHPICQMSLRSTQSWGLNLPLPWRNYRT